ncbi:unnamed protein product [Meloidogyne enterolobii]|uniref:Uncharacterized protein n=1 Tax=Meloidogyne enterolobii TaxID=390850 RepID=A0ACB1A135_MELEN
MVLSIGGSGVDSLLLLGLSGVSGSNKLSVGSIFLMGGCLGKRLRCLRIGIISLSVRGARVCLGMYLN